MCVCVCVCVRVRMRYLISEDIGEIRSENEIVKRVRVLNAWIYNGGLAGAGSIVTKPLAGSTISHEWAEIKTNQG